MAYNFTRSNDQYFKANISVIAQPITMVLWIRRQGTVNTTQNHITLALSTAHDRHLLGSNGSQMWAGNYNSNDQASFGNLFLSANNVWRQVAGVFSSNRARVWIDSTQGALSGVRTVSNFDEWWIGRGGQFGPIQPSNGQFAEIGVWNVELTSDEINSLAKGFKPSRVRPQSLVYYVPLIRNVQELRTGLTLTAGPVAPTVIAHHRVY